MILNLFINTISCTVSNIIVFDFFEKFFKRKYTYSIIFPFIALTTLQITINMFQNTELNYLGTFIFFISLSSFLYSSDKHNIYIISFLTICTLILIESFSLIFINTLFNIDMSIPTKYGLCVCISLILTLLAYYLVIRIIDSRQFKITKFTYIELLMIFLNLISTLLVISIAEYTSNQKLLVSLLIISVSLLISNIYFIFVIDLKEKINQLNIKLELKKINEEFKHKTYINKLEEIEKQEKIFHDLKNHLNVLEVLYKEGDNIKASEYRDKIINNLPKRERLISNEIVQIILNEQKIECQKNLISFDTHINKRITFSGIDEFDLVTLFSNILVNAFEAAIESNEKYIKVYIEEINNFVVTKISNSYLNSLYIKNGIFHTTKNGHEGYGISNCIDTIEKYYGTYSITTEGEFTFQFALPIIK